VSLFLFLLKQPEIRAMAANVLMFNRVLTLLQSQTNVLLVSNPGMGKSSFTRWMADQLGVLHIDINLSQNEGIDVHGARVLGKEPRMINGKACTVTVQAPPDYAIEAATAPQGALINFEELTCIPLSEAGPTLGIFSDYIIGGVKLDRSRVGIIACCNPPEASAGGWALSLPTINRFTELQFEQSVSEWAENFVSYWGRPPVIERWGEKTPENEWARDRAMIAAFAKQFPDVVNKLPAHGAPEKAFCSFRSLEAASRIKTRCRLNNVNDDDRQVLWNGTIGAGAAKQLHEYIRNIKLPTPAALIDDPDSFDMASVKTDQMFYILLACVGEVEYRKRCDEQLPVVNKKSRKHVVQSWQNLWKILEIVYRNGGPKDIVAIAARHACATSTYPLGAEPPQFVQEIVKVVRAAGVTYRS
jgi:hypothetical protein